jgi:hypothetical protein
MLAKRRRGNRRLSYFISMHPIPSQNLKIALQVSVGEYWIVLNNRGNVSNGRIGITNAHFTYCRRDPFSEAVWPHRNLAPCKYCNSRNSEAARAVALCPFKDNFTKQPIEFADAVYFSLDYFACISCFRTSLVLATVHFSYSQQPPSQYYINLNCECNNH